MFCEVVGNLVRKYGLYSVSSAKPLTGPGIRDFSINYVVCVVLKRFWPGSLAISQVVDNGWTSMVNSKSE